MSHVFISYAREDFEIANKIVRALGECNLDTWIDWKNIAKGSEFDKEIFKGIEVADAFLFLISPDSVESEICNQEINYALKNNKRIITVLVRDFDKTLFPLSISKINWIDCKDTNSFESKIEEISTAIHIDYDWVQSQRRLQVKALEWERNNKENSFLLRGKDLQDAEFQLVKNSSKEPYPTPLQSEYVFESNAYENKQKQISRRRGNSIATVGVILLIVVFLGVSGKLNRFIYKPVDMENYWVTIPTGGFYMGSSDKELAFALGMCSNCSFSDEQPRHFVSVDEFELGKYEVTNRQYAQCIKAGFCVGNGLREDLALYPVVSVTWYDAKAYCEWVGGRLPTEAEWEKAARGGLDSKIYPWGDEAPTCTIGARNGANNRKGGDCSWPTMQVGKFAPNGYGLYDMAGNALEWVSSQYRPYPYDSSDGREALSSSYARVVRGGGFSVDSRDVFVAQRIGYDPTFVSWFIGFRCARSP